MAQDLRELFETDKKATYRMKPGHEQRFAKRLDREAGRRRSWPNRAYLIAASLLVLVGLGTYTALNLRPASPGKTTVVSRQEGKSAPQQLSLGDLSPDLKKLEQYYVATINLQLSDLEISPENKAMADDFMGRLAELNTEYEALNRELNTIGPNDQTINALIKNLQLRLDLLYKLKDKMESFKSSENETEPYQSI